MQRLGTIVSVNKVYFAGYLIILLATIIPLITIEKNELFLKINGLNNDFLDTFFYWITYLGDGLVFAFLIILLLFSSYSKALLGLITFLTTAFIAQLLKQVFFADHYRPFRELGATDELHIPAGVEPLVNNSFPSGHTVTAFALATFLILVLPLRKWSLLILMLAWLIGYSRIYLTHHFPIDVWVGAIIGTVGTLLLFWLLSSSLNNKFGSKSILKK